MDIELKEVSDFIQAHHPFDVLPVEVIPRLVNDVSIHYLRRGLAFPPEALVETPSFYLLRSGAVEIRNNAGQLIDKLGEGDCYADQCHAVTTLGHSSEDCLLYRLPCELITSLSADFPLFETRLTRSVNQHVKLSQMLPEPVDSPTDTLHYNAIELVDRQPVVVDARMSITEAARLMTKENVSSILVTEGERLAGMVTDRDIRKRCIAAELDMHSPLHEIMSTDLVTVDHKSSLADALVLMTRHQIHHLPVMKNGEPIGNLCVSDIIRHLGTNSAFIASDIQKANTVDTLSRISERLSELQFHLTLSNTSAQQTAEVMSTITDNITRRLLELAELKFGKPPVEYVWLAGGSQGRHEQLAYSDQDNALLIDNGFQDEHREYFSTLARFVSDGLNACGFMYCPGDAMATNEAWCQPLSVWEGYYQNWITKPEKKALMLSSIFFDLRAVYGQVGLFERLQQQVLKQTRSNNIFIAFMVSNALTHRPPLGFFRQFVLVHDGRHDRTLDIKHRGLIPIVDIGRIYALSEGLQPVSTTDRLNAAYECGAMSREMMSNLCDAFEYIGRVRLEHQARQIREGKPADNYIIPEQLSGLEKIHLKDAFRVIQSMQSVLESRHQAGRLV